MDPEMVPWKDAWEARTVPFGAVKVFLRWQGGATGDDRAPGR